MEGLEIRLQRLERQNSRLRAAGLLVLALIASTFLMGQTRVPSVIEAQQFILVNSEGKAKGELALSTDGSPHLWLYDRNDHLGVLLSVVGTENGGGAMLGMGDTPGPNSRSRLLIRAFDDNTAPFINAKNEFNQIVWGLP